MSQIVLFTERVVGKTTIAAATALHADPVWEREFAKYICPREGSQEEGSIF